VTLNVPGTYPTIQAAINAASASGGDTIAVAAGSYTEQISAGKCVSIVGSGVNSTTIFAPAAMVDSTVPGGSARAIVEARANAYVTIKDLTISGPVTFSPTSGTFGVFVAESATLNMRNARVTTIQQSSGINSAQDGQGIVAGDTTFGTAGSLDLDGVTVDGYQENGILVGGAGSSATIANTTVTGTGPTSLIAQSGIQIYGGASGAISTSTINDNLYSLNSGAATGILTADAGAVSVTGSSFSGNSYAIYQYNSALPLTPSTFSTTACTFTNNPGAGIVYSAAASPTLTNNFISGSNIGIAGFVADNQTSTVMGNSITNATGANSVAIFFNDFNSSVNTTLATINANFNRLSSNGTGGLVGLQNDSASSVNAENNWWGCNAGPGAAGCDIVVVTSPGIVDSDPWLTLSGITASPVSLNYSQPSAISGVNLCTNSAAATVCSPADHTPDSLSVAYTSSPGTNGSVAPASGAFTTGVAAGTTFTSTSGPIVGNQVENVSAIFDNQTITTAITILDPGTPTLSVTGGSAPEGANLVFTVSLAGDSPSRTLPITVNFSTSNGAAFGGTDYTSIANQVIAFPVGDSADKMVNVSTSIDQLVEGNESFTGSLASAANATILTASATGTILDTTTGNEGDITDNVTGGLANGFVNGLDVSRLRRLVIGQETFNPNVNDFQRADVSPAASRGDGCINGLDVLVIRKIQSGELPIVPAAGPTAPPCGQVPFNPADKVDPKNRPQTNTLINVVGTQAAPGSTANVQVEVVAQGGENVLTFTMTYDSNVFAANPVFTMGNGLPPGTFLDAFSPANDRTNIGLYLPNNVPMPAGTVTIFNIAFQVKSTAPTGLTPIAFTGSPGAGPPIVGNIGGLPMAATWNDGNVLITLSPTAAESSVGGQVRTNDGRGLGNTVVTLTGVDGVVRRALTNSFGYYRIDNVPTGATYALGATSKRYAFDTRVITVGDNITDADLTPRE